MSRRFAEFVVFLSSASILVIEIVAGRMLAPYVGVTLETFTGIIGVILGGIAWGAWLGGRLADARPPERVIGPALVVGGITAALSPAIVDIIGRSVGRDPLSIVIAAGVAFLAPAIALSTVGPLVVKVSLTSLDETGVTVGRFSAVGTVGAIAGTFLAGFVLLRLFGTRQIAFGVGAVLVLVGVILIARQAGWKSGIGPTAALLAVTGFAAIVTSPCEFETEYVCLLVVVDDERPTGREIWSDIYRISYVDVADGTHLQARYARQMAQVVDATFARNEPLNALYIGGGGFTIPRWLSQSRPGSTNTVLEIDRIMVEVLEQELAFDANGDGNTTRIGDARLLIADEMSDSYDIVVGDAFSGATVPWHLTTVEFLDEVRRVLTPSGVYVINVIDYPPLDFLRAELASFSQVFSYVGVVAPDSYLVGDKGGNFVVIASDTPIPIDSIRLLLEESSSIISGNAVTVFTGTAEPLTDNYAPADQLISRR
ncbi:MAG: spermidine synthase [Actinobacteria bacterium]|nr:spermidine synthase [Actinomycetota bacterium]